MGGIFGIIQAALWMLWSAGWMLPTFGFVVGLITNWIALKVIFSPVNPVPLFGGRIVLQGYFLKRQAEVAEMYGKLVSIHVLSAHHIVVALLTGEKSNALLEMIHQH